MLLCMENKHIIMISDSQTDKNILVKKAKHRYEKHVKKNKRTNLNKYIGLQKWENFKTNVKSELTGKVRTAIQFDGEKWPNKAKQKVGAGYAL